MSSGRKQYPFNLIEPKWQQFWEEQQSFRAFNPGEVLPSGHPFTKRHGLEGKKVSPADLPPKFYVLDMFPYPSGAGLHVGHPEGYTATDILARYKRATGLHVLHPMGWDAFGLPAEQYAIKTGQHPRATTEANIANFTKQIKSLGFSYDWTREVDTTDPKYFRWTQWIFLKLYNSWFNPEMNKAEPIETLKFPADVKTEVEQRTYRDSKRLAFVSHSPVWWCEQLGTVLANEEVVDGKSEVGGFPVVRKPMRQWMLRITAFAEKLLADLNTIDWSDSLKEMQRNWIGKSEGAEVDFYVADPTTNEPISNLKIKVFTTRPDTLFGATYMVIAPELILLDGLMLRIDWSKDINPLWRGEGESWAKTQTRHGFTPEQVPLLPPLAGAETYRLAVEDYRAWVAAKSDLERTELAKEKTGVFTGLYAINPANSQRIPIFMADYVLASYGTGAIMAVPAHDERDFEFAKKFKLPITPVVASFRPFPSLSFDPSVGYQFPQRKEQMRNVGGKDTWIFWSHDECFVGEGVAINSANAELSLNDTATTEAKKRIADWLEAKGLGKKTINYKLRDWLFSRQRYWGEPFPIVWKKDANGNLYHEALPESALPLLPPVLDDYKPTAEGQPPLARAKDWVNLPDGSVRETNTMPQWAGSCWYYLRYLDARRDASFCGTLAEHYWMGAPTEGLLLRPEQWAARLSSLFAYAQSHPAVGKQYITFGVVGKADAERLRKETGLDVFGYRHFIDDQAISHIIAEHGDAKTEEARGQMAVTFDDLLLIPDVVLCPDRVLHDRKTGMGLEAILYEKRVNGFICCVEEVRGKNQLLAIKTFFKKRTTAAHASDGLDHTPEAIRRSEANKPDAPPSVKATPGVDLYVGGTEHAVLHLLYARFWHKVLFDLGYVSTPEPFFKLVNQGLILGEDGQKMSKSRGNVVNPDDILVDYGADAFRLYEMFMGPLEMVKPWNTKGVEGVYRFLGRVWRMFVDESSEVEFEQAQTATETQRHGELLKLIKLHPAIRDIEPTPGQLKTLHAAIKKVTEDLDSLRFNTAISAMMVFVNEAISWPTKPAAVLRDFIVLLQPFAPHIAEELWEKLSKVQSPTSKVTDGGPTTLDLGPWTLDLAYQPWPKFDPALLVEDTLEIPVQVNGKLRDVIRVPAAATPQEIEAAALQAEKVQPFLAGKTVKKVIVVPKKLVNIVVA